MQDVFTAAFVAEQSEPARGPLGALHGFRFDVSQVRTAVGAETALSGIEVEQGVTVDARNNG